MHMPGVDRATTSGVLIVVFEAIYRVYVLCYPFEDFLQAGKHHAARGILGRAYQNQQFDDNTSFRTSYFT